MRKIVIHPTHRKLLRILHERCDEGRPVVLLKDEVDSFCKILPTLESPTRRNQSVYRMVLNAMNRSFEDLKDHKIFFALNDKSIKVIESVYAKVERNHLCYTLYDALKLFFIRRRICLSYVKAKMRWLP